MKITLTIDEVKQAVAKTLGWEGKDFILVIDGYGEPELSTEVVRVMNAMKPFLTATGEIMYDKKIAAIKCLRELFLDKSYVPNPTNPRDYRPSLIGLGAAKRTVEDWPNFIAKAKRNGCFPYASGGDWIQ
jgi:hypothetical protein